MMNVGVVDYGVGNLKSVANAIEVAGGKPHLVSDPAAIEGFDRIILPGVGAFAPAMDALRQSGMIPSLEAYVGGGRHLLGICLGMHLLCRSSSENGNHSGLGWISATVKPFPSDIGLKVPHMGWNELKVAKDHPLVRDLPEHSDAYFVHSYIASCDERANILAECAYGGDFAAIIAHGSVFGMQFHPEKSQGTGLRLLSNFIHDA